MSAFTNKANIGTPEEYELELADGYMQDNPDDAKTTFTKDPHNFVHVNFHVVKNDLSPFGTGAFIIANLPQGFRPYKNAHSVASLGNSATSCNYSEFSCIAYVNTGGQLVIQVRIAEAVRVTGSVCFYAR